MSECIKGGMKQLVIKIHPHRHKNNEHYFAKDKYIITKKCIWDKGHDIQHKCAYTPPFNSIYSRIDSSIHTRLPLINT